MSIYGGNPRLLIFINAHVAEFLAQSVTYCAIYIITYGRIEAYSM